MNQITVIKYIVCFLLAVSFLRFGISYSQSDKSQSKALAGVWLLDKKRNPNPRDVLNLAWKAERGHRRGLSALEERDFIQAMATFIFPYSDWIKIEQFNNGISVNYAQGEVREYWTDEINTPEFTGLFGETKAAWLDQAFNIETQFEKEKMSVRESFKLSDDQKQLLNTFEIHWKKLSEPVLIALVFDKKE